MSSSTFFTENITFNGELSTNQSPLPGIGGILSSDATGVFQIAVPPQPPSFVDGLTLQTDIASAGGVKWATQLSNIGTGEEIFVAPDELKTLVSGDSSVTITSTSDEIDLSVSASPFIASSGIIEPAITSNSKMMLCDPTTNTITQIGGNVSIISSDNSDISTTTGDSDRPRNVSIIASDSCQIAEIPSTGTFGSLSESSVIASDNCAIIGPRSRNRLIAACLNCSLSTDFGSGSVGPQAIISSTDCITAQDCFINCQDVYAADVNGYTQTTAISCSNIGSQPTPTKLGDRNVFLSCNSITDSSGVNQKGQDNLFKGSTIDIAARDNCIVFADGGGSVLSATADNQFISRFGNGYEFYSNSVLTSGSIMAAGGGWATISDENTKENLERLDDAICLNICEKLLSIDVCKYNYIGNPPEQISYGPTAQDWHSEFSGEVINVPRREEVASEDGQVSEEFVLDESGERIFDQVPAKDPRCIEMSDMLGILMASVKALNTKINVLIEADVEKDQQITALLEDANEKDEQINNLVEAINDIEVEQPEVYFTNNPLTQSFLPGSGSGVKVFEYVCQKSGKISLVSSTCFKKTSGSGGTIFIQLRLNNQLFSPSIQSGYEGEQSQYAPDLSGLTINWSGDVNQGDILTVYGLATSGTFSLVQSGQFSGATGAQMSITIY